MVVYDGLATMPNTTSTSRMVFHCPMSRDLRGTGRRHSRKSLYASPRSSKRLLTKAAHGQNGHTTLNMVT